jgi:hypothetical protein
MPRVGISIGSTICPNTSDIRTSYKVTDQGDGNFEAEGTLTISNSGPCRNLKLVNVPFTIVGTSDGRITFSTSGAGDGSTYTEGTRGGGDTCVAPIANFVTSGPGRRTHRFPQRP